MVSSDSDEEVTTPKKRKFVPPNKRYPKGFRFHLPPLDPVEVDLTSDNETGKKTIAVKYNRKVKKIHLVLPRVMEYFPCRQHIAFPACHT